MDPITLSLLLGGGGLLSSIFGASSANNAVKQQQQQIANAQNQMYGLANAQNNTHNNLGQLFLPSILRDMGISANKMQLGNLFQSAGQASQGPNYPQMQQQNPYGNAV